MLPNDKMISIYKKIKNGSRKLEEFGVMRGRESIQKECRCGSKEGQTYKADFEVYFTRYDWAHTYFSNKTLTAS